MTFRPTFIDVMNRFLELAPILGLSVQQRMVMIALIHGWNRLGRPAEWEQATDSSLCAVAGVSRPVATRAREELCELNFLQFTKGSRHRRPRYRLGQRLLSVASSVTEINIEGYAGENARGDTGGANDPANVTSSVTEVNTQRYNLQRREDPPPTPAQEESSRQISGGPLEQGLVQRDEVEPRAGFPEKSVVLAYCEKRGWPVDAGSRFWLHFDEVRSNGGRPISPNWHWWSRLEAWVMEDARRGSPAGRRGTGGAAKVQADPGKQEKFEKGEW